MKRNQALPGWLDNIQKYEKYGKVKRATGRLHRPVAQ